MAGQTNPIRTHEPLEASPALRIESLRVDYGDVTAVDDLSLTIAPGEIFGLVGPNGAGKTSTIRVLANLLEPTYGEVHVLGHDLFEAPGAALEKLGYMPDLAPVIPNLKVWEFLDLYAHSYGLRGADKRARVDACLAKVKLSDSRDQLGKALSRGMTQRVVLAKTLLHDPKLLLLDEPASGMDPIARRDLRRVLQELAAGGASIIVSSHILTELADMCTSVGIMHKGRLLRHGSIAETLESIRAEAVQVRIELVGSPDAARNWLTGRSDIEPIETEGNRVGFGFSGEKSAQAALLREMVEAGIEIVSFSAKESGIESLLMDLIEGDADQ